MNKITFTFEVDETLKTEVSTAAKKRDHNVAQLLRDFFRIVCFLNLVLRLPQQSGRDKRVGAPIAA